MTIISDMLAFRFIATKARCRIKSWRLTDEQGDELAADLSRVGRRYMTRADLKAEGANIFGAPVTFR